MDPQSGMQGTISLPFPAQILLPFPTFPDGVKNTCSQFSRKLFNQFENCLRIFIKEFEFYKCVRHDWRLLHNLLSIHFPGGKCINWNFFLKHSISLTLFNQFLSSFYQNYCTVPGHLMHVTDDLKNVGQRQHIQ